MKLLFDGIGWFLFLVGMALLIKGCSIKDDKPLIGCNGAWVATQCK